MPSYIINLKSIVDKLDVDKLVATPVDLSKLSDVVKMLLLKKMYMMQKSKTLKKKIPDITNLATNTILNAKTNDVKNKTPTITNLAATAALNAKINEVKNLATTIAPTYVENKIPDHGKHITTPEFDKKILQKILL